MLFSSEKSYLCQAMRDHIQTAYNNICVLVLPADKNPEKKVVLVVSGNEGEVYLDKVGNDQNQNQMLRQTNEREQLLALHSQISAMHWSIEDFKATQQQHRVEGRREFQMLQANI
jgi:hypothetical protein